MTEKDLIIQDLRRENAKLRARVQEWISVDDRLPERDGAYLVTIEYFGKSQGIDIRYFTIDGEKVDEYELAGQKCVWFFYDSEYGHVPTDSVTHWLPLPEPPKGVNDA